ncbi:zinc finger protein OZF-like [Diorhabda carinulata]|uniref:zinc finger protein OZF-like n=1 Tax=Diorhabda carinulata TaxID=1163345 RepID=UPI0025A29172|nr:zinc finger protein OZF-like [Diorhabda carinulata]
MFEMEVTNHEKNNVITFTYDEIDIICRSCLSKEAIVNLFEIAYKGTLFSEIFNSLFAELNQTDALPKKICNKCVILFTQFCAFKEQIVESQILLQSTIGCNAKLEENNINVKEEKDYKDEYDSNKVEENTVDCHEICEVNDLKKEIDEENVIVNTFEIKLEEKEYVCSYCDEKFSNIARYRNHRQRELLKRRPKKICHICSKEVVSNRLKEHLISHSNKKPFSCDICGKKFSRKENLSRHKYVHTEVKPHMCHICGKGFIQAPSLTDHLRTHNDIAPFVSQYCGRKFTNKQAFERHLKLHMKNPEMPCKGRKGTEKYRNAKFICEYCKKEFKTKQMLDIHTRSHTGDRPYVCSICGSKFIQNAHLRTHLYLHKGNKPYNCGYCGKSFAMKGNLNQHVRIHTGDRPHTCNICLKRFCTRSSLKKHKIIHDVK